MKLEEDIQYLKGIGPKKAELLKKMGDGLVITRMAAKASLSASMQRPQTSRFGMFSGSMQR